MNRFEPTTEKSEKKESFENKELVVLESPEALISKSEQEVSQFQKSLESEFSQDEERAENEGLVIESSDKEALQGLINEVNVAKEELVTEIGNEQLVTEKNIDVEKKQSLEYVENIKSKKVCPKCGKEGRENSNFCEECGGKMETLKVRVCLGCGKENKMGNKFCEDCGGKFEKTKTEVEKADIIGIVKDRNFEGSLIVKTQDTEGRVVGYALRKNSNGELEGNKIGYMEDGSIGAVYKLHESDFAKFGENGVLEKYEQGELNERDAEFAREEIQEVIELEDLEKKAADFIEALSSEDISIENAERYENDYVIPAYKKAEKIRGIIGNNNNERSDNVFEKEKPFNAISSIIKNKEALCIHFLTGFSNANNRTSASGIESSGGDTFTKRSKEALKQLNTLAGLSPSISTSVFADSHNFDGTWYRDSGQPVGVILREGECTEISSDDANTVSASPKHRRGYGEIITEAGLEKILSSDEGKFTQSSYNEFVVSEPKIGALFIPTGNPVEKICLKRLLQENAQFGYPLLLERNGKFYQVPRGDLEKMVQGDESEPIAIKEHLTDSQEVSREAIRQSMSKMEDDELQEGEKKRFDKYVNNYDLKPHFDWADELEIGVKTQKAYLLDKEISKIAKNETAHLEELSVEGQFTERLINHFNKSNQEPKYKLEERVRYYINGESYKESELSDEQFDIAERREEKTEYWEYEEEILGSLAEAENIIGVGELTNLQTKTNRSLRIIKYNDGSIYRNAWERMSIISCQIDGDNKKIPFTILTSETTDVVEGAMIRDNFENTTERNEAFKPFSYGLQSLEDGLLLTQGELVDKIINGKDITEEKRNKAAIYAFSMSEMCKKDNNLIEAEEWKNTALSIAGNIERYNLVKSKLNEDGTLKLNEDDIKKL